MLHSRDDCGRVGGPMRHAVFFTLFSLSLTLAGCKTHCRQLAEKMCACTVTTDAKNACLQSASTKEASFPPTDEDEARCEALAEGCDCRLIDTPQGKERCGLALPNDTEM